jgi:hypothetical protein
VAIIHKNKLVGMYTKAIDYRRGVGHILKEQTTIYSNEIM